jgi:hypothetical protein
VRLFSLQYQHLTSNIGDNTTLPNMSGEHTAFFYGIAISYSCPVMLSGYANKESPGTLV